MNYKFAYSIGFHPWEDAANEILFVDKFAELMAREEAGHSKPFGKALDLGCGSAIWGVELAKRGWSVTGVDMIPKALERAEQRVLNAGVDMRLVQADATNLSKVDVGDDFNLILDSGTYHDFNEEKQMALARSVSDIAASEATVFLLIWPRRIRPLIRGVSRTEIETAFSGLTITDVEPSHFRLPKILEWVLRPDEKWYRLRREL